MKIFERQKKKQKMNLFTAYYILAIFRGNVTKMKNVSSFKYQIKSFNYKIKCPILPVKKY